MRKTLAAVITATTVAAAISGVSLASASTASARPAGAAGSQIEHFQIMSTSSTASTNALIAYGAFGDGGTDIVHANGSETYRFANGSFVVVHTIVHVNQVADPKTCLTKILARATYTVSGGTGRFTGITGSGKATVSILSVEPRVDGVCSATATPSAFQETVDASGPIRI